MHNSFKNNNDGELIVPSSWRKFWDNLEELWTPWKPAVRFHAAAEVFSSSFICLIIRGEGADFPTPPATTWLEGLLVAGEECGCGGSLLWIVAQDTSLTWIPDSTSAIYMILRHINELANDKNLLLFINWLTLNTHMPIIDMGICRAGFF